jgi:hypothetical protein
MTAAGMTGDQASKWITWLFKQPFANRKGGAPAQAQARAEAPSVSTEGIYRFTDGSVYRVVESKRNPGRFVAKMVTAHGWEWAKGMIFKLTAEMRMTPEQIAEFGIRTQVCAQCSRGLEDPISKKIGLGTKCGPAILGGDEYKAARKAAALDPQVAEQLAAIKAGKAAAPAPVAQAYVQVRDLDIADDNQAEAELANRDWAEWKNEFAKREAEQERAAEEAKFAWKQANERF